MGLVVLKTVGDLSIASGGKILKASEVSSVLSADTLVEQTRNRCDAMLRQAAKGYEDSKLRGWRKGTADAKDEWSAKLATIDVSRHAILESLAPALTDVVLDALSLLIKDIDQQKLFESTLASVNSLMRQARWAHLKVHPDFVDEAKNALQEMGLNRDGSSVFATIVPDSTLQKTDCIFETDVGIADGSVSVQLKVSVRRWKRRWRPWWLKARRFRNDSS